MRPSARNNAPKYQIVKEQLRKKIEKGIYPPGGKLPTGDALHKQFKVNRLTAMRALEELAREGWVVRRQGSGTYVADRTQKPLLPGRALRFGLLWNDIIQLEALVSGFHAEVVQGALREWGLLQIGKPPVQLRLKIRR